MRADCPTTTSPLPASKPLAALDTPSLSLHITEGRQPLFPPIHMIMKTLARAYFSGVADIYRLFFAFRK
jgi:hypothetical protein